MSRALEDVVPEPALSELLQRWLEPKDPEERHTAGPVIERLETATAWEDYPVAVPQQERHTTSQVYEWLENSTAWEEYSESIERDIEAAFRAFKGEIFEDSVESEFSKVLTRLIRKYSSRAIDVMTRLIITEQVDEEVASKALQVLGHINHSQTYDRRLWLLERSLYCSSEWIRDGAILGLAWLDDPHAIPYIRKAMKREPFEELREDMGEVLLQLEKTGSATDTEED